MKIARKRSSFEGARRYSPAESLPRLSFRVLRSRASGEKGEESAVLSLRIQARVGRTLLSTAFDLDFDLGPRSASSFIHG
jgi:hypothetical protein